MTVEEKMNQMRKTVSDKDILLTREMKEYFTDYAKAVLNRYGSDFNINVKIIYDRNGNIASTSFSGITLNAGCTQVQKNARFEDKILYLKGLLAHELSHILYMDNNMSREYDMKLERGIMFPSLPNADKEVIDDITETLKNKKSASKLSNIASIIKNIVEDGYGENIFIANFYGSMVDGMKFMRKEFKKDLDDIHRLDEKFKENPLNTILSAVLQYSLYGEIKGENDKSTVVIELNKSKNLIDRTFSENFRNRLKTVNDIIAVYWDYIKPCIADEDTDEENDTNSDENNSKESGNSNSSEKHDEKEGQNSYKNFSNKPELPDTMTSQIAKPENTSIDRKNPSECENIDEEFIENILESAIRELAEKKLEEDATLAKNKEANEGSYKGCQIYITRNFVISDYMISEYEKYSDILEISRRIQKGLKQHLEDRRKGGKRTNLYLGRKVEVRSIIRNDGKCFYNNTLPSNIPRIAVTVIIDESGSMNKASNNGLSRIENAKKTAILVEDFCRELQFPISIIGSTADYEHDDINSELTLYSSFDSFDRNDKYRLTEISAKACCRDGAAYNYAYECFKKRPEEIKLLFIISDGTPNAYNYGGEIAINELRTIHDKCKKNGIITFAAAVGEDKEKIENIYGESFLDISNLDDMPNIFINKIKQFIKK